jgi:hypothetical protein
LASRADGRSAAVGNFIAVALGIAQRHDKWRTSCENYPFSLSVWCSARCVAICSRRVDAAGCGYQGEQHE